MPSSPHIMVGKTSFIFAKGVERTVSLESTFISPVFFSVNNMRPSGVDVIPAMSVVMLPSALPA